MRLYTVEEARARLAGIPAAAVLDLVRRGELGFVRVGGRLLIEEQELQTFVAARRRRVLPLEAVLANDDGAESTAPTVTTTGAEIADRGPA